MRDRGFDLLGYGLVMSYFILLGWHVLTMAVFPPRPVPIPPEALAATNSSTTLVAMTEVSHELAARPDLNSPTADETTP